MLNCKEQKNPIRYMGRDIQVSHKALNAHFFMCGLAVDEASCDMYLEYYLKKDYKELQKNLSEREIAELVEKGIKEEFLSVGTQEQWNSIEG